MLILAKTIKKCEPVKNYGFAFLCCKSVCLSKQRRLKTSYIYKRKKGVSTNDTITKERCQFPTDILIIPYTFSFVSAFSEIF